MSALVNSNLKNEMQEKFKILLTDVFIQLHVNVDSPKIDKDYAFEIYFGSIATIFIFGFKKVWLKLLKNFWISSMLIAN
ncbi:hypothetical protein V8V50_01710 [Ligilactobacillus salivarius]